VNQLDLKNKIE